MDRGRHGSRVEGQGLRGNDLDRLLRPSLRGIKPYQPIRPPGAEESDAIAGPVIKLDGNENVYGCSPRVQEALRRLSTYHIYPDPDQTRLRKALESYTGLDSSYILAGAGSDELIDLLLRLFLDPGQKVIDCVPTFGMYSFSTELMGGAVTAIRRRADFHVDISAVIKAIDAPTKVVFVASPNNPTGNVTPREDILALLDTGRLIVVDEAYYEFCGKTVVDLVPAYDNLVVLRTFSKWAGLAGLRVGYGLCAPEIVARLMAIKQPYNINVAAEVAALESLEDREYLLGTANKLVAERDRMFRLLKGIPYLEPIPSEANFILSWVKGHKAQDIQQKLRRKGIFVRYFDTPILESAVRISAGKPEHTDAVIAALREWA